MHVYSSTRSSLRLLNCAGKIGCSADAEVICGRMLRSVGMPPSWTPTMGRAQRGHQFVRNSRTPSHCVPDRPRTPPTKRSDLADEQLCSKGRANHVEVR